MTCVEPEVELVPQENSTTVRNENISGFITQVCGGAMELLAFLPSMSNAVKELQEAEKRVQSILAGITADSDPEVRDNLADLRQEFRAFIRVGKDFLEYCLSMANYARHKPHVNEIKEQLAIQILDKLNVYFDSLSGYLKDCNDSFDEFRATHKDMDNQVSSAKGRLSDKHTEAKKEASDAVEKHERAVFERTSSEVLTKGFGMASSAISIAGAEGMIPPEVAVLGSLFSFFQAYLARTNEGAAVQGVMKQERTREEMATKEKILQDALICVVKLRESVLNAESLVKDMKSHLNHASTAIKESRKLQECADSNNLNLDFHDVINKMDTLQRAADRIVEVIGEDGRNPISPKRDELAERTDA